LSPSALSEALTEPSDGLVDFVFGGRPTNAESGCKTAECSVARLVDVVGRCVVELGRGGLREMAKFEGEELARFSLAFSDPFLREL
jgi:hypothetical protein